MCIGPPIQSKLNIFWDLLPCHFQNGADITGYIIQYSRTSGGEAQNISSSDNQLTCEVYSGRYQQCLSLSTVTILFTSGSSHTFQVAAVNRYGVGPFSDPITTKIDVQSIYIIILIIVDI